MKTAQDAVPSCLMVLALAACSTGAGEPAAGEAALQSSVSSLTAGPTTPLTPLWDFLSAEPAAQPLLVNPRSDCGMHSYVAESWWMYSKLRSAGPRSHEIYSLAHVLSFKQPVPVVLCTRTLFDKTAGIWLQQETPTDPGQTTIASDRLSAVTPSIAIIERPDDISISAVMDGSSTSLSAKPAERVLYNAGAGSWPWLGGPNYQYAFPRMATTGTVSINGKPYSVTGETWFDRQYGDSDIARVLTGTVHWTWFGIQLEDRDVAISAWEYKDFALGTTNTFATIRGPDGTQTVAPMILTGSDVWESPTSHQKYPTHFQIEIPSTDTQLELVLVRADQEIQSSMMPRNQGAGAVWGRYQHHRVLGHANLEMVGNFR